MAVVTVVVAVQAVKGRLRITHRSDWKDDRR
jgi:hypothetical protein